MDITFHFKLKINSIKLHNVINLTTYKTKQVIPKYTLYTTYLNIISMQQIYDLNTFQENHFGNRSG